MGKLWSLLFLLVPILGVGIFVFAANDIGIVNHWLPEDISEAGSNVDNLFYFILYLTGTIFIGTSLVLFWFMWKYDGDSHAEPVKYVHGSHTLEVVWSIIPAAALVFIAVVQMKGWADAKIERPQQSAANGQIEPRPPIAEVTGRQFEWRLRYAGKDGIIGTTDDVFTVNELVLPVNEEIVLAIKSQDVLHSFFLPKMRIKQDVVPGMKQYVWFKAVKEDVSDIVCAELCGWGHYKMKGRLTVTSRQQFDKWLDDMYEEQRTAVYNPESGDE